ncbi:MAG: hypothetical protein ACXIUL_00110 [Wenzhouxiangella sp.]
MSHSLKKKLKKFLSRDFREQLERRDKLKKLMARMRERQRELEDELAAEYDPAVQAEIRQKIELMKKQRSKGIEALETLRADHRSKADD